MGEISSKELVRDLFQLKELPRTPFVPWVSSFAAKLEQVTVEEMLNDPGLLSSSLLNAQQLFGYDAVATVFDPALEAEACGCELEWSDDRLPRVVSHPLEDGATQDPMIVQDIEKRGRVPVVLEALKRINILRGKQVAIFGIITGPLSLARHLRGETLGHDLEEGSEQAARIVAGAAGIGLKLARKYCETGVDAIVISDEMLGGVDASVYSILAGPLKSIWNVTKFYGVRSLLLTTECEAAKVEPILDLRAEGAALGSQVDGGQAWEASLKRNCCYGTSVEPSNPPAESALMSANRRGHFLTTDWEVQFGTDVNAMHRLMAGITRSVSS
jgi:uroporphyrinogen decarboxylase